MFAFVILLLFFSFFLFFSFLFFFFFLFFLYLFLFFFSFFFNLVFLDFFFSPLSLSLPVFLGWMGGFYLLTFWPPGPDDAECRTIQAFLGMSSNLKVSIHLRAFSISSSECHFDAASLRQEEARVAAITPVADVASAGRKRPSDRTGSRRWRSGILSVFGSSRRRRRRCMAVFVGQCWASGPFVWAEARG